MTSEPRIERLEIEVSQMGQRIDRLEAEVSQLGQRVDQMGQRVDQMGQRLAGLEGEVRQLSQRLTSLENTTNSRFNSVDARLNTLTIVVFGNVAATVLAAVGLVVAILIRG
jgi:chromosome segregation ATPase